MIGKRVRHGSKKCGLTLDALGERVTADPDWAGGLGPPRARRRRTLAFAERVAPGSAAPGGTG
jgi:hypothetical protein